MYITCIINDALGCFNRSKQTRQQQFFVICHLDSTFPKIKPNNILNKKKHK